MSESKPCDGMNVTRVFCDNVALAMAYVPMQCWDQVYEPDVGLVRGTIFHQLDLPFIGEEAVKNGR